MAGQLVLHFRRGLRERMSLHRIGGKQSVEAVVQGRARMLTPQSPLELNWAQSLICELSQNREC